MINVSAKKAAKKSSKSASKPQDAPAAPKKAAKKASASLLPAVAKKGTKSDASANAIIVAPKRQAGPLTASDREAIMASMTPATKKVAKQIDLLRAKSFQIELLIKYDIGKAIGEILTEVQAADTDVSMLREIKLLADYFGETMSSIYDHRNIAATFKKDFIEKNLERALPDGRRLTWSHLREIQKIQDKDQRKLAWNQIFSEGLSSKQLANRSKSEGTSSTGRKGGSGRNVKMPKKPNEIVQRTLSTIKTATKFLTALEGPMSDSGKLMKISKKDCTPRYVQKLEETAISIKTIKALLAETAARFLEVQRHASQVSGITLIIDAELVQTAAKTGKEKTKVKSKPVEPVEAELEDDEPEVDTELSTDLDLDDDDEFEEANDDGSEDDEDDEDADLNEEDSNDSDDFDAADNNDDDDVASAPSYQSDENDLD